MTKLFLLDPEVSGGLGEKTIISNFDDLRLGTARIPNITKLEYVFDDWFGDDLITSNPCFIATERLVAKLKNEKLSGFLIDAVSISKSDLFRQIHETDIQLPKFYWLKVLGKVNLDEDWKVNDWSGEDFCYNQKAQLVVTEECLEILKLFNLSNCDVHEIEMK